MTDNNYIDRSDDLRNLLEDSMSSSDESCHESDVDSSIGEQFDELRNSELDRLDAHGNTIEDGNISDIENISGHDSDNVSVNEPDCTNGNYNEHEIVDDAGWREWTNSDVGFDKFRFVLNSGFKSTQGQMPQTELDFFQLFFTDELINELCNETNRYAKEKIQKNTPLQKKSIWWSWTEVTIAEMKAFLGVLINMGLNPKPELDDYFSSELIDYQPFFKNTFSKDRFKQIFWNLHVSPPNSCGPIRGTLTRSRKIRRVVQYLDKQYRKYYIPGHKISIDGSTVAFKGRIHFKVYNKDKPIKWGIKVFVVSEASSGYICGLEPYLGKATTESLIRPDLLVTSRIVLHLVKKLEQDYGSVEGFHVFTDRFYTSIELASALHEMKVHLTGTIMRNRKGLPIKIRSGKKGQKSKLKKGDIKAYRKEDKFSIIHWKDTNDVTVLSTLYNASVQTVRRIKKGGVIDNVTKPLSVCKYNESMGGVDLTDHYISSYPFIRKSLKWWRKVFFWLFETAIVNAYILYTKVSPQTKKIKQRVFRKRLVTQLVGEKRNNNKRKRPASLE